MTVEVGYENSSYVNVCDTFGGGPELLDQWRALGDLLAYRPGWHFDIVTGGRALWRLGAFGEAALTIQVVEGGVYRCCDHGEESDFAAATTAHVERWLDHRETTARQISPLLRELIADADWERLRVYIFEVRVSWSDGWYSAVVRGLPEEACFERTLAGVLRCAREMLVRVSGALPELAGELHVRVKIDPGATSQFLDS
jgi:hypothetical protein